MAKITKAIIAVHIPIKPINQFVISVDAPKNENSAINELLMLGHQLRKYAHTPPIIASMPVAITLLHTGSFHALVITKLFSPYKPNVRAVG